MLIFWRLFPQNGIVLLLPGSFMADHSIILNGQKFKTVQLSVFWWIDVCKTCYICIMKYYSSMKKNKPLYTL